jgi:PEP-CTERM motif
MRDNRLLQSRLTFTDSYNICTDLCRIDYTQSTHMRVDSLNRYVAGVPEPGALGLMGMGLGLTLLARRRRGDSAAAP